MTKRVRLESSLMLDMCHCDDDDCPHHNSCLRWTHVAPEIMITTAASLKRPDSRRTCAVADYCEYFITN